MGSCYSCKSNGGKPPTYTTVAMTTAEANTNAMTTKDGRRPPYSRGGSTGSSFGFRKRTPATLKSQTQDRTSELVNIYETKIAGHSAKPKPTAGSASPAALRRLASAAPNHRPNSGSSSPYSSTTNIATSNTNHHHHPRPQPGFAYHKGGPRSLAMATTTSTKAADTNCNEIATGGLAASKTVPSNKLNSALGSPKRIHTSAASLRMGRENYCADRTAAAASTVVETSAKTTGYRYIEDYENGNHHLHNHRSHDKRVAGGEHPTAEAFPRPAIKVKTLQSNLPKPQVPILVSSKSSTGQRGMAPEPMDISAETLVTVADDDNMMFDADSGLGNSVSEQRRSDGDTETLAEVDQIEGDTASVSSRHHQMAPLSVVIGDVVAEVGPQSLGADTKRADSLQPQRSMKVSGIARFRSALPTAKTTATVKVEPRRSSPVLQARNPRNVAANAATQLAQPAVGPKKKAQTTTSPATFSPKKIVVHKGPGWKIGATKPKDFGSSGSEEWKIVNETRQKENVTPDVLSDDGGGGGLVNGHVPKSPAGHKPLTTNATAGTVLVKQETAPLSLPILHREPRAGGIGSRQTSLEAEVELSSSRCQPHHQHRSVMTTSDDSTESSSLRDPGLYSPPSEKDFFLIDDEICDQPALIACQSLDTAAYRNSIGHSQRDAALLSELMMNSSLTDTGDEGLTNSVNQKILNIPSQRRTSHSLNTLSPTSSIGSDDLMCDYDLTEDAFLDGNRTSNDIFDESGQLDGVDSDARFHQTTRTIQQRSPAVGSILQEWNGLKGSHGFDGRSPGGPKPKYRSQRLDSNGLGSAPIAGSESSSSCSSSSDMPTSPAVLSASGTNGTRRTTISFRPPKQMSVTDSGDGCAKVDASSYRYMCQDLTSMKTMLLKLKRSLQEADTLNPFEMSNLKNGLFLNLANSDPPDSILPDRNLDRVVDEPPSCLMEQENADLRRQVIFFQEQLEDRDRTIKLLQQQMAKFTIPSEDIVSKEKCNAACQTERQRTVLGNSLPSTGDDNLFGSTVSFRIGQLLDPLSF